jgi:aspartate kinase
VSRVGKGTVVLKVGGSILTRARAYGRVAAYLKRRIETEPEEKLVVVVSAQKLATSVLERSARRIVRSPSPRALDLLWSTGELRSVAILTLHLEAIRVSVVGLNVHETGLRFLAEAQLCPPRPALRGPYIDRVLAGHAVVVVPGFLATRSDEAIVTLGRGGSDLSAVLLAVGLGASRCELLKDVPGYFEEDPRANTRAAHLPSLSFKEALGMAERGCELVQPRALAAAADAGLPLVVRSLDERATPSVISPGTRQTSAEPGREPVAAECVKRR